MNVAFFWRATNPLWRNKNVIMHKTCCWQKMAQRIGERERERERGRDRERVQKKKNVCLNFIGPIQQIF